MNRRERRKLERQGKIPKSEPVYTMKPSEIKDAALKGAGEQAIKEELNRRCLDADKQYTLDIDTMYLWTLHVKYGWGLKRLKQFYMDVFAEHIRMRECYEMGNTYPERHKLKDKGIDIEAWYNALFDENGNFKAPEEVSI